MFTGLIEDVGTVVSFENRGAAARLAVRTTIPLSEVRDGDSIAVNGGCLTVTSSSGDTVYFDLSPETVQRSSLRGLKPGQSVNLERALRLSDRLGGHIVTGHIDCVATVASRRETSGNIVFSFRLGTEWARYIVEKGSITIDGISLTVNSVSTDGFTVNIIPHTAAKTTLAVRKPGDEVNIETDILAKYVERLLGKTPEKGLTAEFLAKNGFM